MPAFSPRSRPGAATALRGRPVAAVTKADPAGPTAAAAPHKPLRLLLITLMPALLVWLLLALSLLHLSARERHTAGRQVLERGAAQLAQAQGEALVALRREAGLAARVAAEAANAVGGQRPETAATSALDPAAGDAAILGRLRSQLASAPPSLGLVALAVAVPARSGSPVGAWQVLEALRPAAGAPGAMATQRLEALPERLPEWLAAATLDPTPGSAAGRSLWLPIGMPYGTGAPERRLLSVVHREPLPAARDRSGDDGRAVVFVAAVASRDAVDFATAMTAAAPAGAHWLLLSAQGEILAADQLRLLGRPYTDWGPAGSGRGAFAAAALRGNLPAGTVTTLVLPQQGPVGALALPLAEPGWRLLYLQPLPVPPLLALPAGRGSLLALLASALLLVAAMVVALRKMRRLAGLAERVESLALPAAAVTSAADEAWAPASPSGEPGPTGTTTGTGAPPVSLITRLDHSLQQLEARLGTDAAAGAAARAALTERCLGSEAVLAARLAGLKAACAADLDTAERLRRVARALAEGASAAALAFAPRTGDARRGALAAPGREVAALLPPPMVSVRAQLAEATAETEGFSEEGLGLFAPVRLDGRTVGSLWMFAPDPYPGAPAPLAAPQQALLDEAAGWLADVHQREQLRVAARRAAGAGGNAAPDAGPGWSATTAGFAAYSAPGSARLGERLLREITDSLPGVLFQLVRGEGAPGTTAGEGHLAPAQAGTRLRFVSLGVEAVFGVAREQALASFDVLVERFYPEDHAGFVAQLDDAAVGEEITATFRITHAITAELRWLRCSASVQKREPDGRSLVNGVWLDVTVQKTLELTLEGARADADAANEAKSRFLANMSHEIRTPMNAIIGLTNLAATQSGEPKVRDYLHRVEDAAHTLLSLLNDILDFSKIEAGRLSVERIPFDLQRVLDRVEGLMGERAAGKGLAFEVALAPDVPRTLVGDPLRLSQVLLNLVSNAVKFTDAGSVKLAVEARMRSATRPRLRFTVRDTGPGMDELQVSKLFSAFEQADSSTTRRYGGTGLGLTISKQLVALMGGDLTVRSARGQGSSFRFTLEFDVAGDAAGLEELGPAAERRPALPSWSAHESGDGSLGAAGGARSRHAAVPTGFERTIPDPARPPVDYGLHERAAVIGLGGEPLLRTLPRPGAEMAPLAGARVLVVDDNDINLEIAAELLKAVGVRVTTQDSAAAALAWLARNSVDAVLMDVQMPGMDGLTATAEIRRQPQWADLPVIAMTANAMPGDRERCLAAGMNDHIPKPIDPDTLRGTLAYWVREHTLARSLTPK